MQPQEIYYSSAIIKIWTNYINKLAYNALKNKNIFIAAIYNKLIYILLFSKSIYLLYFISAHLFKK